MVCVSISFGDEICEMDLTGNLPLIPAREGLAVRANHALSAKVLEMSTFFNEVFGSDEIKGELFRLPLILVPRYLIGDG